MGQDDDVDSQPAAEDVELVDVPALALLPHRSGVVDDTRALLDHSPLCHLGDVALDGVVAAFLRPLLRRVLEEVVGLALADGLPLLLIAFLDE